MIIDIRQDKKELFSAEFSIYRGLGLIGGFSVQGSIVSIEADAGGSFLGKGFAIMHIKGKEINAKNPYRPYAVKCNGAECGVVYYTETKSGMFKSYSFTQMQYSGMRYDCYSISLGNEGGKEQIYCQNRVIAQIDIESIVYNDLHNYRIYAVDEFSAELAVIICVYGYVTCSFEPGKKTIAGKTKYYSKTYNKELLAKYNPNFIKNITL